MYVGLIAVAAIGALLTGLVATAERIALPWQRGRLIHRSKER